MPDKTQNKSSLSSSDSYWVKLDKKLSFIENNVDKTENKKINELIKECTNQALKDLKNINSGIEFESSAKNIRDILKKIDRINDSQKNLFSTIFEFVFGEDFSKKNLSSQYT